MTIEEQRKMTQNFVVWENLNIILTMKEKKEEMI